MPWNRHNVYSKPEEAVIGTANTFTIDGHIRAGYYTQQELEENHVGELSMLPLGGGLDIIIIDTFDNIILLPFLDHRTDFTCLQGKDHIRSIL